MHCVKLLGQRLSARDFDRQVAEIQICAAILNALFRIPLEILTQHRFGWKPPRHFLTAKSQTDQNSSEIDMQFVAKQPSLQGQESVHPLRAEKPLSIQVVSAYLNVFVLQGCEFDSAKVMQGCHWRSFLFCVKIGRDVASREL